MNNKRKYLSQSGITLIALVVTIVVLLILAGVTINTVFSDNGIIRKAKDTQYKANESTQKDMEQINALENWINNHTKDNTNTTEPTEPTTPDTGEIIGTLDLPQHASTDRGDVCINPITAEMYQSDLQSIVEKLNATPRTSTVKTALNAAYKVVYGAELDEIYLYGQGEMKDNNVDVNQYKFLSPVVDIAIEWDKATEEDPIKIIFVTNNMIDDNMTVDILYYCNAHGWEVIEGERIGGNQVECYLHDSGGLEGGFHWHPGALIYKLAN